MTAGALKHRSSAPVAPAPGGSLLSRLVVIVGDLSLPNREMSVVAAKVRSMTKIHVDCDTCLARGPACGDCVMTALLGPVEPLEFDAIEETAIAELSDAGLVPPLRLVRPQPPDVDGRRLRIS